MSEFLITKEDDYIIASKPSGLLSQHTPGEDSLTSRLQKHFSEDLHILTRLDRPVSGLVLYSRSRGFTKEYNRQQKGNRILKKYIAITEGSIDAQEMDLKGFHAHDKKAKKARVYPDDGPGCKEVFAHMKTIEVLDNYSVVELSLHTGAFHQLRAQLAFIGHPIKGDVKYGSRRSNRDRSIHLHAHTISLRWDGKERTFEVPIPTKDTLWEIAKKSYNKS